MDQSGQIGLSVGLMTTPIWAAIMTDINLVASTVAALCGAIIGLRAVFLIIRAASRK